MRRVAAVLLFSLFGLVSVGHSATHRPQRNAAKRARAKQATKQPAQLDPAAVNDPSLMPIVGPKSSGAAVLRAQILLTRAHFSVGEINSEYGDNFRRAVEAFQQARELPVTGQVEAGTWQALNTDASPALTNYTVTEQDIETRFTQVPSTMAEQAQMPELNYRNAEEMFAERFRISPQALRQLNKGKNPEKPGEVLTVPNVTDISAPGGAALVEVSQSRLQVVAKDREGKVLAVYPASIGSEHDPLPIGQWKINGVARNPVFHYNPKLFWDAHPTDTAARIPSGPNNPVGVVWIDLSKEHYGIHGTPEPSGIGRQQSHGCIRLTNWDAMELAAMVKPGTPAKLTE